VRGDELRPSFRRSRLVRRRSHGPQEADVPRYRRAER
jgi:hypothetical protein